MKIKFAVMALMVFLSVAQSTFAADLKERHGRGTMVRERTAEALNKKDDNKAMAQLKADADVVDESEKAIGKEQKFSSRHGRAQMTRDLAAKGN